MDKLSLNKTLNSFKQGSPIILIDDEMSVPVLVIPLHTNLESIEKFLTLLSGTIGICLPENHLLPLKLPTHSSSNLQWDMQRCTFGPLHSPSEPSAKEVKNLFENLGHQKPCSLSHPGRFFPLKYELGGVLKCASPVEASIDLCKEAGIFQGTAIGALIHSDGSPFSFEEACALNLPVVSITEYVKKRRKEDPILNQVASARLPTKHGSFKVLVFQSHLDNTEHIALVKGDLPLKSPTLVRMHSECITGDIFSSTRCDCGSQLDRALQLISEEGSGVLVYLRGHEGRGIGLTHKLHAYNLQDKGRDTVQANIDLGLPVDKRDYGIGAQILNELGVTQIKLLSNNPKKYHGLLGYGLEVIERVPLETKPTTENYHYLLTKKEKLGHLIDLEKNDWEKSNA